MAIDAQNQIQLDAFFANIGAHSEGLQTHSFSYLALRDGDR